MKTSKAQQRARDKWDADHKELKKKVVAKSTAKRFITKMADWGELDQLENLIKQQKGEVNMIVNIEFKSEGKNYSTTIEFEHLNDDNTEYVHGSEVATAMVDIFNGNDIDKDMVSNYESYYTEDDIQDADHIKVWFLDQIKYEYQDAEITGITIE